ncbi:MAG: hypothetical protein WD844_02765 [Thermoleophilaceae bacterium]
MSPDGSAVTRFAATDVPTTCGTVTITATGSDPITGHSFSKSFGQLRYSGSFTAPQQASGTLRLVLGGAPGCTSDDVSWSATTAAPPPGGAPPPPPPPPGGGPPPPPPPPPQADDEPPALRLGGARAQRVGRGTLRLTAACPEEPCQATARGSVSVPATARVFRFGPVTRSIEAGSTRRVTLRLPRTALRSVRRALARRRTVTARIRVVAEDAAGNRATRSRSIRLRR